MTVEISCVYPRFHLSLAPDFGHLGSWMSWSSLFCAQNQWILFAVSVVEIRVSAWFFGFMYIKFVFVRFRVSWFALSQVMVLERAEFRLFFLVRSGHLRIEWYLCRQHIIYSRPYWSWSGGGRKCRYWRVEGREWILVGLLALHVLDWRGG